MSGCRSHREHAPARRPGRERSHPSLNGAVLAGRNAFATPGLIEAGLIDELHLWVFPVVAGKGDRLLEGLELTHDKLIDSTTFASGIVVHVLDPTAD